MKTISSTDRHSNPSDRGPREEHILLGSVVSAMTRRPVSVLRLEYRVADQPDLVLDHLVVFQPLLEAWL